MDWHQYEVVIKEAFEARFPEAAVTLNAKVLGRHTKTKREIDILIEDHVADVPIRVIVDAKYFSKKVNIKVVESFISMAKDVEAHQGVLITNKGYSKAALNRAHYGSEHIELDILNFDELRAGQGLEAIPYAGNDGLLISAPMGWVVDNSKNDNWVACLYQRGKSFQKALNAMEFIYLKFWKKTNEVDDIESLAKLQNERLREEYGNVRIENSNAPKRNDKHETRLRKAYIRNGALIELTGYIDIGDAIAFAVSLSPKTVSNRHILKLNHLLRCSLPIKVKFENTEKIETTLEKLQEVTDPTEMAKAYADVARMYKEMGLNTLTLQYLLLSWSQSKAYPTIVSLLREQLFQRKFNAARLSGEWFLSMSPHNPRVMRDLIEIYSDTNAIQEFDPLVQHLLAHFGDDDECVGNILFHSAQHHINMGDIKKGKMLLSKAKNRFGDTANHPAVIAINDYLEGPGL